MVGQLKNFILEAEHNVQCRAILLRSAHANFCHGLHLTKLGQELDRRDADASSPASASAEGSTEEPSADTRKIPKEFSDGVRDYAQLLAAIYSSKKPVACVIEGEVKAGGVGLACACDIIYCTPSASFEMAEVLFGLIPANVFPYILGRRITPQKAVYLALTARTLDAKEARRIGLADEIFEAEEMEKALRQLFKQLLRSSPHALNMVKRFAQEITATPPPSGAVKAQAALLDIITNREVQAGIADFQHGEVPNWFGRFKPTAPLFLSHGEKI